MNAYGIWLGIGIYHSGLEVHGVEYGYGAHEQSSTGIFEVEPKKCPGFTVRKSILVGETEMKAKEVRIFLEKLAEEYQGNKHHLITRRRRRRIRRNRWRRRREEIDGEEKEEEDEIDGEEEKKNRFL